MMKTWEYKLTISSHLWQLWYHLLTVVSFIAVSFEVLTIKMRCYNIRLKDIRPNNFIYDITWKWFISEPYLTGENDLSYSCPAYSSLELLLSANISNFWLRTSTPTTLSCDLQSTLSSNYFGIIHLSFMTIKIRSYDIRLIEIRPNNISYHIIDILM